jgi:hypothetical protein
MPVHSPPLSRCRFLRHAASTAAGLFSLQVLRGCQSPQGKYSAADTEVFAFLADTHIDANSNKVADCEVGSFNTAKNLTQVVVLVNPFKCKF